MFDVAVKNLSSAVSDAQLEAAMPAFQTQVTRDFGPVWGVDARLRMIGRKDKVLDGELLLGLFDTSDQAGALGYHETTAFGAPLGKVFVKTTLTYGGLWTVTTSHELLEMLGDPEINLTAMDERGRKVYAYEACDAVESDDLAYRIDDTPVSDFVLLNWFQPGSTAPGYRSFNGAKSKVTRAFQLAPGGYISFLDLDSPAEGWKQETARTADGRETKPHGLSRLPRRMKPHTERLRSVAF